MIEDQLPAEYARPHEGQYADDAQHASDRQFLGRHLEAPDESPAQHDREDSHGEQCHGLMLFHDFVYRFTMLDRVLGELAGDDGSPPADHAHPQRPDRRPHQGFAFGPSRGEIEEHRDEEQRRGEIVEDGVPPGGVITEH